MMEKGWRLRMMASPDDPSIDKQLPASRDDGEGSVANNDFAAGQPTGKEGLAEQESHKEPVVGQHKSVASAGILELGAVNKDTNPSSILPLDPSSNTLAGNTSHIATRDRVGNYASSPLGRSSHASSQGMPTEKSNILSLPHTSTNRRVPARFSRLATHRPVDLWSSDRSSKADYVDSAASYSDFKDAGVAESESESGNNNSVADSHEE
ncbi:hypothetical protein DM02DRAFT_692783 [Periconia macrospinosa]|uniref:Uncharacterized protein n=1 Tax=Periconia macrospinosa TaxID=97972 RepID=A0A2V1E2H7_9PLEO|nr:hypothetical protein DM02DRAFT_692783 [Periconia macrospinosa]